MDPDDLTGRKIKVLDFARDVDAAVAELLKPSRHASPHGAIVDGAEPTETRFMRKKDILS